MAEKKDKKGRVWVESYRREPNKVPGHYRGMPKHKAQRGN